MKKKTTCWLIRWESKVEGFGSGFYRIEGSEEKAISEVKKLKEQFKKEGRRPKVSYEKID